MDGEFSEAVSTLAEIMPELQQKIQVTSRLVSLLSQFYSFFHSLLSTFDGKVPYANYKIK
jgi:hypothetical protein